MSDQTFVAQIRNSPFTGFSIIIPRLPILQLDPALLRQLDDHQVQVVTTHHEPLAGLFVNRYDDGQRIGITYLDAIPVAADGFDHGFGYGVHHAAVVGSAPVVLRFLDHVRKHTETD